MVTQTRKAAAGAVVGVAVLQVVVFTITTAVWVGNTMFSYNACDPRCDWAQGNLSGGVYYLTSIVMFLCTGLAIAYAGRTGKALTWVPLLGSAGIVAGLLIALSIFRNAVS